MTYGSHSELILANKQNISDLGEYFGHGCYEAELHYLVTKEWVFELDDAIWRRTKLGMWLNETQKKYIAQWISRYFKQSASALSTD